MLLSNVFNMIRPLPDCRVNKQQWNQCSPVLPTCKKRSMVVIRMLDELGISIINIWESIYSSNGQSFWCFWERYRLSISQQTPIKIKQNYCAWWKWTCTWWRKGSKVSRAFATAITQAVLGKRVKATSYALTEKWRLKVRMTCNRKWEVPRVVSPIMNIFNSTCIYNLLPRNWRTLNTSNHKTEFCHCTLILCTTIKTHSSILESKYKNQRKIVTYKPINLTLK